MAPGRAVSRRGLLLGRVDNARTSGAVSSPSLGADGPVIATPPIHPRSEWGADLLPTGALTSEQPNDVRFLLVHHSETPNDYAPEDVAPRLRSIYDYHTMAKGWPDVAYNFFVDAFGGIWEGRTGSIGSPVRGDATGGSQGFALLCCFVGDHSLVPPSDAAIESMASLTAWLASSYSIDLTAGPTISFVSRGSNRWPAGTNVTTDPIAGHRDMSQTACPGDAAYPLVRGAISARAQALGAAALPTATPSSIPAFPRSVAPAAISLGSKEAESSGSSGFSSALATLPTAGVGAVVAVAAAVGLRVRRGVRRS